MLPNKHTKLEVEPKSTKENSCRQSPSHRQGKPSVFQLDENQVKKTPIIPSEIRSSQQTKPIILDRVNLIEFENAETEPKFHSAQKKVRSDDKRALLSPQEASVRDVDSDPQSP